MACASLACVARVMARLIFCQSMLTLEQQFLPVALHIQIAGGSTSQALGGSSGKQDDAKETPHASTYTEYKPLTINRPDR
eukprot:6340618-Amphidinium_carterae.2